MREMDRPPKERVSLLDREPTAADRAAAESTPLLSGLNIVQSRVALRDEDNQMLVGRDADDGLYFTIQQSGGGGAAGGGTRGELRERGALVMWCGDGWRLFVGGIVPDEVTAVRVGDVPTHLQDNAFLAEVGHDDSRVPVSLFRATPQREPNPRPLRSKANQQRWQGIIETAGQALERYEHARNACTRSSIRAIYDGCVNSIGYARSRSLCLR